MDDREFDLAGFLLVRDEILAIYHARTQRWQALQGAALALAGLALFGYFNRARTGGLLTALLVIAVGTMALASHVLRRYDLDLARELRLLRAQVESLKRARGDEP